MAQPTVLSGTKLMIFVGDGGTPETFGAPCGITTTGMDFAASSNSSLVASCDDPYAAAWDIKDILGLSAQVAGSGVMAVESFAVWNDWFQSAAIRNVKIVVDHPLLGYWLGAFGLTSLKYSGQRGQKITIDVTLVNSGTVPWISSVVPPVFPEGHASATGAASAIGVYKIAAVGSAIGIGSAAANSGPPPIITATDTAYFASSACSMPFYGTAITPPNAYFADTDTSWYAWEGWEGSGRRFYCKTYNHTTGQWSGQFYVGLSPLANDDHGVPSIERDAGGYMHLFGGVHDSGTQLTFHTNNPNDPTAWTQDANIPTTLSAYPKPSLVGSTLWLFVRDNTAGTGARSYSYVKTTALTAGVPTWSTKTSIIDYGTPTSPIDAQVGSRVYASNHVVVGTDIHFVTTFADFNDNYRQDVFYYVVDTTTGNVRNFDSSVTVTPGSLPINFATSQASFRIVNQVASSTFGNVPALGFDTNNHPHVGYMDGPTGGPYNFKHIWHNGTAWQTPDTVGGFATNNALHRFDTFGVIPLPAGSVDLYWITAAAAATFNRGGDVSKKTWSGGSIGAASVVLAARSTFALDCISVVRYASTSGVALARATFGETTGNPNINNGFLRVFVNGDSGLTRKPFQTETNTLVTAIGGTTTDTDKDAIDDVIATLKGSSLWTTADLYYNFKAPTSAAARLNWKNPGTNTLVDVGAGPTFVANSHFVGNGTTTRLSSGFIPSSSSIVTQNNCGVAVQALNDIPNDSYFDMGAVGGGFTTHINARNGTGFPRGVINGTANASASTTVPTSVGWVSLERSGATTTAVIKDGVVVGTNLTTASAGVPTGSIDICGTSGPAFSARQIRSAWFGGAATVTARFQHRAAEVRYNFAHS